MNNIEIHKIKRDKSILIGIAILLVAILVASSYYLINNWLKQKNQEDKFEDLEKIIIHENTDDVIEDETNEKQEPVYQTIDLKDLKLQNKDLIGWIKVEGTNINYPVMQNGEYYLRKNFYKEYSQLGTPFLAEQCNLKTSDCLIVYGHHIKSGLMFGDLMKYKNYSFYKNNKYIKFYTIENNETIENVYEIIYAFKTTTNPGGFRYYFYNQFLNKSDYEEFIGNCQSMQLYNTGVNTNYGDKFIMLSTCEYSQENGRMVLVGKKV